MAATPIDVAKVTKAFVEIDTELKMAGLKRKRKLVESVPQVTFEVIQSAPVAPMTVETTPALVVVAPPSKKQKLIPKGKQSKGKQSKGGDPVMARKPKMPKKPSPKKPKPKY